MMSTNVSMPRIVSQSDQGVKRSRDGVQVQNDSIDGDSSLAQANNSSSESIPAGGKADAPSSKGKRKGASKANAAKASSANTQPLAPEARQLPLSTQQLGAMQSSAEQSPSSATNMSLPDADTSSALFGDPFGSKTPQAVPRARMPSLSGASGIPASLSFGLMSPSVAAQWGNQNEHDYLQGPHSQAGGSMYQGVPAITPSIFDNLGLPGTTEEMMAANIGDLSGVHQYGYGPGGSSAGLGGNGDMFGGMDRYYTDNQGGQGGMDGGASSHANTPQSDGSSGLANYAFELLQKQSVWNLDQDSLNMLNQRRRAQ